MKTRKTEKTASFSCALLETTKIVEKSWKVVVNCFLPRFGGVMLFNDVPVLNFENKKNCIEEQKKVDR